MLPGHPVDVSPALQQSLPNAQHAVLRTMIQMIVVVQHFQSVSSVGRCEGLVPCAEDIGPWIWGCMLRLQETMSGNSMRG